MTVGAREAGPTAGLAASAVGVAGPRLRDPGERRFYATSSCDVCGKGTLSPADDLAHFALDRSLPTRTEMCMRTTLDLDDALVGIAKRRAADEGATLTAVIEAALRDYLTPRRAPGRPFRLRLLTKRGRPVPGVNFADRDALYERMEGRR